jgi:HSP20 family protein
MTRRSSDVPSQFDHIRQRMEQARQRVIGAPGSPFSVPFMEPAVDVYETEDAVVIIAEIAGIGQEEVELAFEGTTCILRGERKSGRTGPKRDYSQMEIGHGPFLRELLLPAEVNPDAVQTVYKDGMLQLTLPKASPARSKRTKLPVR